MKLFSFFQNAEKTGADSTIGSEEIIDGLNASVNTDEVETTLSLHPEWDIPQEQDYVFRFLSNELEPLKPDQISLSGIDIELENGSWLVKAFFRSSLDQQISIGSVELMILDEDGKMLAAKEFDLKELGDIPARSARPWVFLFTKDDIFAKQPPSKDWKIAFNVQSMIPHKLDLEQAWEDSLMDEQKEELVKIMESLPKLKPREVNISGFQMKRQDDGGIAASAFIRNGHPRKINIEKLPLELIDAAGDLVARGSFTLDPLSIKANTSKPWTFIYPGELIQKAEPDFTRWTVRVPQ